MMDFQDLCEPGFEQLRVGLRWSSTLLRSWQSCSLPKLPSALARAVSSMWVLRWISTPRRSILGDTVAHQRS